METMCRLLQSKYVISFYTRRSERGTSRLQNLFKIYAIFLHQKTTHIQVHKHDLFVIMCELSAFLAIVYFTIGCFITAWLLYTFKECILSSFCKVTDQSGISVENALTYLLFNTRKRNFLHLVICLGRISILNANIDFFYMLVSQLY